MAKTLPLEGIRVVDLSVIWAAPFTTWLMGCLGAEVIHVDNTQHMPDFHRMFTRWPFPGDLDLPGGRAGRPGRKVGERPWNRDAMWARIGWNRLSCAINIDTPEGKEVALRLVDKADIFMENNSAHAMESLGLGPKVMMERNPRLICINMPSWGRSGPYMNYVGWGALHEAIGGHDWMRGYPDEEHPAHNVFRFHMDSTTGPTALFGAIMGLIRREKTGKGMWVDYAQMESMFHHFGEIYMDAAWNGRDTRTIGNRHPTVVQGCYLCRGPEPTEETARYGGERWINITINNDEEWKGFCDALGNPEWTKDEKFSDVLSRYKNHDELDEHISGWTRLHDNFEIFYMLQEKGVPAGPVQDWRDTYLDPQLNAREFFQTITQADIGTFRYPGWPWKFSETPLRVLNPPCMLGEHDDYVFRQVIGMSEDEVAELTGKGTIGVLDKNAPYPWAGPMPENIWGEK